MRFPNESTQVYTYCITDMLRTYIMTRNLRFLRYSSQGNVEVVRQNKARKRLYQSVTRWVLLNSEQYPYDLVNHLHHLTQRIIEDSFMSKLHLRSELEALWDEYGASVVLDYLELSRRDFVYVVLDVFEDLHKKRYNNENEL